MLDQPLQQQHACTAADDLRVHRHVEDTAPDLVVQVIEFVDPGLEQLARAFGAGKEAAGDKFKCGKSSRSHDTGSSTRSTGLPNFHGSVVDHSSPTRHQ